MDWYDHWSVALIVIPFELGRVLMGDRNFVSPSVVLATLLV